MDGKQNYLRMLTFAIFCLLNALHMVDALEMVPADLKTRDLGCFLKLSGIYELNRRGFRFCHYLEGKMKISK